MAEIKPFKGVLYSSEKFGKDIGKVCAPPYDVISTSMQEELFNKSEFNIVNLILGRSLENDNNEDNRYIRAARSFNDWYQNNVLIRDKEEQYYVYAQEYEINGQTKTRIGFIGLMKIEDPEQKGILPHEKTHSKPKKDRLSLIKEVKCNLSPIFALFADEGAKVTTILEKIMTDTSPLFEFNSPDGKNLLWKISEQDKIDEISKLMSDKKVFIADGHHRYEVSRQYRDFVREKKEGGNAEYVMMYFADMDSEKNLTVLATHRVIKKMDISEKGLLDAVDKYFTVTRYTKSEDMISALNKGFEDGKHSFGFYGGNEYIILTLKNEKDLNDLISGNKSDEWKKLDVSILHAGIFENLGKVNTDEGNIIYVRTFEEAEDLVNSGQCDAAFFLNPTRVEELKAVAEHGDMMPQKSTYFYPKLLTGLVVNKLD